MLITYKNKKPASEIIAKTQKASLINSSKNISENKLIYCENLSALKFLLDEYRGKINLIYIDPPFATNSNFKIGLDRTSTISSSIDDKIAYSDKIVGEDFLEFIRERLVFLKELLSDKGSIYLHIDYKIGHYIKILMDEIFGIENFRNDISRIKCNPKNFSRKGYGNIKDMILFYSKTSNHTWNEPKIKFSKEDKEKLFKKIDKDGRFYTTIPIHAPGETINGETGLPWNGVKPPKGRHWRVDIKTLDQWNSSGLIEWSSNGVPRKKIFMDERCGKKAQDILDFKDPQYPSYPTEKNLDLLKFIIEASSNEGDLVLDCFAGSGTSIFAAQTLNRKWIAIDNSPSAINIIKERLSRVAKDLFLESEYSFFQDESLAQIIITSTKKSKTKCKN